MSEINLNGTEIIDVLFNDAPVSGEASTDYLQSIAGVISQLPPDCINVYKDLQLIEVLTGETIFYDALHLNERGHKLLYAIAASKLGLAALSSELSDVSSLSKDLDDIIATQEALIGG